MGKSAIPAFWAIVQRDASSWPFGGRPSPKVQVHLARRRYSAKGAAFTKSTAEGAL